MMLGFPFFLMGGGCFAEDEEEDFPFKDWVGHLGERTLRGPFSSKKQQEVSQWLLEAWPSYGVFVVVLMPSFAELHWKAKCLLSA